MFHQNPYAVSGVLFLFCASMYGLAGLDCGLYLPDGVASPETNPLGNRTVLLRSLSNL